MHPCVTHRVALFPCDIMPDYDGLFLEFAPTSLSAPRNSGLPEFSRDAESNAHQSALSDSPSSTPSAAAMNSSNASVERVEQRALTLGSIAIGSVLLALCVLMCVGNLFVVLAVCVVRRLRQPANLLTVSLAVADISVAVLVAPAAALVEALDGEWPFGLVLCKAFILSDMTLCSASILNLCAISVDRYAAIRHPFGYQQRRGKWLMCSMIAVVWGVAVLVSLPPLFLNTLTHNKCHYPDEVAYQLFAIGGSFYLPLVVMSVLYGTILLTARRIAREDAKLQCVRQMHLKMARAVANFRGKSNSICKALLPQNGCAFFGARRRSVSPALTGGERAIAARSLSSTAPVTPATPAAHRAVVKTNSSQITAALASLSVAIALTTQVPAKPNANGASCERSALVSMNAAAKSLLLSRSSQCVGAVRPSQDSGVVSYCGSADGADKCARATRFQYGGSGSLPIVNEQRVLRLSVGRQSDATLSTSTNPLNHSISTRSPINSLLATIPQRDEPGDSLSNIASIANTQSPPISPEAPDSDCINFNFSKRGSTQSNCAGALVSRTAATIDEQTTGLTVGAFAPDAPSDMSALSRRMSSIGASSQASLPMASSSIGAQSLPTRNRLRVAPEIKAIITLGICLCGSKFA